MKRGRKKYGFYQDERTVVEVIRLKRRKRKGSVSPTPFGQIARELNAEGFRTQTERSWRAEQVRRILQVDTLIKTRYVKKTALSNEDFLDTEQITACRKVLKEGTERVVFETLLLSGLRAAELCNLRIADVKLRGVRRIVVRKGKGCKQRAVDIGPALAGTINGYIKTCRKSAGKTQPLFINRRGRQMHYQNLLYLIRRLGGNMGLDGLHPHVLRHTFATQLYNYTKDLLLVQQQLGHSRTDTTAIYAKVIQSKKIQTLKKFEQEMNRHCGG